MAGAWQSVSWDQFKGANPNAPAPGSYSGYTTPFQRAQMGQNYAATMSGFGGATVPAPAANDPLSQAFGAKLQAAIEKPGMSDEDVEKMVNRSAEGLSESQMSDQIALEQFGAAAGAGRSNTALAGRQAMDSNYAGKRASAANDIRLQAAQDRFKAGLQGLAIGADYLGRERDRGYDQWKFSQQHSQTNGMQPIGNTGLMGFGESSGGGGGSGGRGGWQLLQQVGGGSGVGVEGPGGPGYSGYRPGQVPPRYDFSRATMSNLGGGTNSGKTSFEQAMKTSKLPQFFD